MLTKVLQNVHFSSAREGNLTREFIVTNETSNAQRVWNWIAFRDAKQATKRCSSALTSKLGAVKFGKSNFQASMFNV